MQTFVISASIIGLGGVGAVVLAVVQCSAPGGWQCPPFLHAALWALPTIMTPSA